MSLPSAITLPSSSREEKIAMCRGLLFETILIFVGNFLTIVVFALKRSSARRLIKTLLFVSAAAVLSWLPFLIVAGYLMGIHEIFVP